MSHKYHFYSYESMTSWTNSYSNSPTFRFVYAFAIWTAAHSSHGTWHCVNWIFWKYVRWNWLSQFCASNGILRGERNSNIEFLCWFSINAHCLLLQVIQHHRKLAGYNVTKLSNDCQSIRFRIFQFTHKMEMWMLESAAISVCMDYHNINYILHH